MKIRGSLFFVFGQVVLLSLSSAVAVHDVPGAPEYFKTNSIPVEHIRTEGQTVIAFLRYDVDLRVAMARLEDHQGVIFKRLASDFPDSRIIRIRCSINGEPVCQLEMDTSAVADALKGMISDVEMEARLRAESFVNFKERFDSLEAVQERMLAEQPRMERSDGRAEPETAEEKVPETAEPVRPVAETAPRASGGGGSPAPQRRPGSPFGIFILLLAAGTLLLLVLILLRRVKKRESAGLKIDAGLEVFYPDGHTERFEIHRQRVTIGRGKDNSLVIDDPEVSARHAEIIISEDGFLLKDADSANGTFVNGERIVSAMIYQDDEIRMGSTRIHLR